MKMSKEEVQRILDKSAPGHTVASDANLPDAQERSGIIKTILGGRPSSVVLANGQVSGMRG
ncbi:MAG: hypothetical protein AAB883_00170 [Patescibacteria group bacterium]